MREVQTQGRLVVICGIDGSGKTVQTQALAERARSEGLRVQTLEFPRYREYREGFFGEVIARYLRGDFGQDPSEINPYLAAIPFACDRWQAAPRIRQHLRDGALVVCNRYVSANLAHQGGKIASAAAREEFFDWLLELEHDVFAIPRPHMQIWLDMPPRVAVRLIARKGHRAYLSGQQDIHEGSLMHLEATRQAYSQLAARDETWRTIECASGGQPLPVQAIADRVWAAVSELVSGMKKMAPRNDDPSGG